MIDLLERVEEASMPVRDVVVVVVIRPVMRMLDGSGRDSRKERRGKLGGSKETRRF